MICFCMLLLLLTFVNGSLPLAADAQVFTAFGTFIALVFLVVLQRFAGKFFWAELQTNWGFFLIYKHVLNKHWEDWQWHVWYLTYLTFAGKLRYCFLNSQISGCSRFGYFHTAIWASGDLVSESANETMKQIKALAHVSQLTKNLAFF